MVNDSDSQNQVGVHVQDFVSFGFRLGLDRTIPPANPHECRLHQIGSSLWLSLWDPEDVSQRVLTSEH